MAFDLTRAEHADAVRRYWRPTRAQIIAAVIVALLIASAFGLFIYPDPIRGY